LELNDFESEISLKGDTTFFTCVKKVVSGQKGNVDGGKFFSGLQ